MNRQVWIDHLTSWKTFLNERISLVEDEGERIKCERQIKTIERVRCGAVLNPSLLCEFISPSTEESEEAICEKFYFDMNDSQKKAVRLALGENTLSLIQGPPGTGKTQVIAEICLQLLSTNPSLRILVCSETHVAVNNLLSRIAQYSKGIRIVRIRDKENDDAVDEFSPESIINLYLKWASESIQNKDAYNIIEGEVRDFISNDQRKKNQIEKALALSANIVGMTCNRAAAYDFRDRTEMFDVAIIDEVCKATLPEILSPLVISRKAVLLGDPKQLPPVFCSEEQEIIRSIQNCNLNRFMYIDTLFNEGKKVSVLDTQYRMSNQIGCMISDLFYNGSLKNGRNEDVEDGLTWITYEPSNDWPIPTEELSDRPKIYNEDECQIVADLVKQIISEGNPNTTVAVIAPYRAQISSLRKACINSDRVKIDTVDGFQGKESDVVIFSVTRTKGSYRFLADDRRINVALSRARDRIFIVGNQEYSERDPLLKTIMGKCKIIEWQ
ncbi:AAA domain-containing protein [Butyrivibrio fibrisolvens DSM 3071]|uniref:AAA domain-containing protein n=1 Tax=Butyrivibrio fibrisolvens DSM 3071 TaxID=1121131 RepID=A0A1M6CH14_BUTFI|nr:AAA domain-containing protein [Butyrivibrio fibrisolvens]SHI60309.1 AAA domain-containing protein [Butyrivibrio fibrisolvens DSM 3071]